MRLILAVATIAIMAGCATTQPIEPRLASPTMDFAGAETVTVELANFRFAPREIYLRTGRPYVLKIVNTASGGHDFTAPEFFAASVVGENDAALIAGGQVELRERETAAIRLVPATGEYRIVCTHFGHVALGMAGRIIVR